MTVLAEPISTLVYGRQLVSLEKRSGISQPAIIGVLFAVVVVGGAALLTCLHYTSGIWKWNAFRAHLEESMSPAQIPWRIISPQSQLPPLSSQIMSPSNSTHVDDTFSRENITYNAQPLPIQPPQYELMEPPQAGSTTNVRLAGIPTQSPDLNAQSIPSHQHDFSEPVIIDAEGSISMLAPRPSSPPIPTVVPASGSHIPSDFETFTILSNITDVDEESLLPPEYQSAWGGATS